MGTNFSIKIRSIETALFEYLKWFEVCPQLHQLDCDECNDKDKDKRNKFFKAEDAIKLDDRDVHPDARADWDAYVRQRQQQNPNQSPNPNSNEIKNRFTLDLKPSKITLDPDNDDIDAKNAIAELAQLLAYLRCEVKTWDTDKAQGLDYGYSASLREDSKRASDVLYNLARGHALTYGRLHIILDDVKIVLKTVLSTAEFDRAKTFLLLLMNGGKLSTTDIETHLKVSAPTARKTMAELRAIGMVEVTEVQGVRSHESEIQLYDNLSWFLGKEFEDLRDGFEPADYRSYMKSGNSLKARINYSALLDHIIVFQKVFDGLANRPELMGINSDDRGTVGRFELVQKLMETDIFTMEQAHQIIDFMLEQNMIKKVMLDTYRKNEDYDDPFLRRAKN